MTQGTDLQFRRRQSSAIVAAVQARYRDTRSVLKKADPQLGVRSRLLRFVHRAFFGIPNVFEDQSSKRIQLRVNELVGVLPGSRVSVWSSPGILICSNVSVEVRA